MSSKLTGVEALGECLGLGYVFDNGDVKLAEDTD